MAHGRQRHLESKDVDNVLCFDHRAVKLEHQCPRVDPVRNRGNLLGRPPEIQCHISPRSDGDNAGCCYLLHRCFVLMGLALKPPF